MIVPLWVCVAFFHKEERKEEIDRERVKERPIYGIYAKVLHFISLRQTSRLIFAFLMHTNSAHGKT